MAHPIPPGTLLRQRYLIQQVLGQGGFGRTYLAVDQERFNESCVLKEFTVPYHDGGLVSKSRHLFQREASILYQIQHPQIPRFWAAFEDEQQLFLVQSFVEGPTYRAVLSDRKKKGRAFCEAEVLHFLNHLLPVLTYIHERDIIHRDISPDNLILHRAQASATAMPSVQTPTNLPVLIDFGAVKEATSHWPLTTSTTRVGKIGYAPPEQLQTGKVYPNSDLYALAASCLALFTGREPRTLLDSQTLTWQWDAQVQISDDLGQILKRMLAVYPGDRFQTANEVLVEIQSLLQDAVAPTLVKTSMRAVELPMLYPPSHSHLSHSAQGAPKTGAPKGVSQTAPSRPPRLGRRSTPRFSTSDVTSSNSQLLPSQLPTTQLSTARARPERGKPMLPVGIAAAFAAVGVATPILWGTWVNPSANSGEKMVWIAGAQIKQEDAAQLMEPQPSSPLRFDPALTTLSIKSQKQINAQKSRPVQRLEFLPRQLAIVQQGNLQGQNQQPYSFEGTEGQVITVSLTGPGVILNILNSRQQPITESAQNTHRWTGQLPANDQYYVQVIGTGAYTLDIALTPPLAASLEKPQPVLLDPGTTSTKIVGTLLPNHRRRYTIRALQGQTLGVKLLQGKVALNAIAPNQVSFGKANSKQWEEKLPMDGDYQLEVSATQTEDYTLWIEVR